MRARVFLRWLCGVAPLIGVLLVASAPVAGATEAEPFEIKRFTMQTTRLKEVSFGAGIYDFVNEPYAFTQAGGHPSALTTTVEFTTEEFEKINGTITEHVVVPTHDPKDIVADLPPGLLGNPTAVPRCPLTQILTGGSDKQCPADTQVGVYLLHWLGGKQQLGPIVNATPELGQSAEFALENKGGVVPVLTAHLVRTAQGYGITVVSNEIPMAGIYSAEVTFWGVPADESHDAMRGRFCGTNTKEAAHLTCEGGNKSAGITPVPFLTMGTDCSAGPETATVRADSWVQPGVYQRATTPLPGVTGCDLLAFNPSIEAQPDTLLADAPVGLAVNLQVPQVEKPGASATPQLRRLVATLPEGMSISPGIVDGIQACNATRAEGEAIEIPTGLNAGGEPLQPGEMGPEGEERGLNGEPQLAPGHCPDASIVGTAKAFTPLLNEPVEGHVYLARPGCGGASQLPCTEQDALDGNLYQLYLELGGAGALANTGVNIKVRLKTEANPATGQLTTVADENPQLPFSGLEVDLNGGPRAPIDNPAVCGPAVTTTDFTPWSAPGITPAPESLSMPGTPAAPPFSEFAVKGCSSPPGLSPGFLAGTVTPQAGQFSAFTMNLSRKDREQYLKGIQVHTPPGLLGMLSSVPLCGEPEADNGHCPEASKIGTTRVASGAGSHPFEIEGNVYLTGPYRGAPFGLSIVTRAVAGPFNLGLVVVRARIMVDPETSTLTITTDETGPYAVPQIIFGVPLRLQRVTVNIDRPNFMFNPTNCGAPGQPGMQQVTAVVSGSQNATATIASQFAVGGCKSLVF